jgi:hypothetical protein
MIKGDAVISGPSGTNWMDRPSQGGNFPDKDAAWTLGIQTINKAKETMVFNMKNSWGRVSSVQKGDAMPARKPRRNGHDRGTHSR